MPEQGPTGKFIEGLYEAMQGRAKAMAPHFTPGDGAKKLDSDDELAAWNHRALTIEQEWELWRAGMDPADIGDRVFPDRRKLVKSGGRPEPKQWYQKANALGKRAEARRLAEATTPEMPAVPGWEEDGYG